ncbi:hypothetical protein B296_00023731 [Ensete ventricosum]|uniref:Uncharacterized protein n=1 Tax=Ensete ventricosum TaxID=4639 RepID=A0A426ZFR3_ENSVE|nr:hypothetical protein B296_00023731 [Ensete ventricosum]
MEELSESDVMWPDGHERRPCDPHKACSSSSRARTWTTSAPVAIPRAREIPSKSAYAGRRRSSNNDDTSDREDDVGSIPPHVIIARRPADTIAFSVRVGKGRTLKGRDLSRVRNSILQMTGFLETR